MITRIEKNVIRQMTTANSDMALYDSLYRDFRRIRHDFANYVQSSQFESEDEDFILRLRMLKKETLKLVDALLERLGNLPLEQLSEGGGFYQYPYLTPEQIPVKHKPREEELFVLWEEMKLYFVHQLEELPTLIPILEHLQDRLQRSLPPDEWEAKEHLEECDSIRFHETADSPLLAAFIHVCKKEAEANGVTFQYRLNVPDCFTEHLEQLFYLLARAQKTGNGWTKDREGSRFRLYLASGLGLWHFSMNLSVEKTEEDEYEEETKKLIQAFSKDKNLLRILKKRKASMEVETEKEGFRIDIMG